MGKTTGIAWTNSTFSPWHGCVEVSPACDHCYARVVDVRFNGESHWGKDTPRRFFGDKHWNEPLKWNRDALKSGERWLVFCASMADVFEERDDLHAQRQRLWALIKATPALTWLLLTKRPQNIGRMLHSELVGANNIWLGTTIESPEYLWRAEALAKHGAAAPVRFASMEPLLAEVHIASFLQSNPTGLNWIISGSESGDQARDTPTALFRSLRDVCAAAGVPFLLKQANEMAEGISYVPLSGTGSSDSPAWRKRDLRTCPDGMKRVHWIVERPYLDGVQHVGFPPVVV